MRAYFILTNRYDHIPEVTPEQIEVLMAPVDVCMVCDFAPVAGRVVRDGNGSRWQIVTVDDNGRTGVVAAI